MSEMEWFDFCNFVVVDPMDSDMRRVDNILRLYLPIDSIAAFQ